MEPEDESGGFFDLDDLEKEEAKRAEETSTSRCEQQRKRPPIVWQAPVQSLDNTRRGIGTFYNLEFPTSEDAICDMGAKWLCDAMHAAGTLPATGSVASLKTVQRLGDAPGGAARLLLTVAYGLEIPYLDKTLLVKIANGEQMENQEEQGDRFVIKHIDEDVMPFPYQPCEAHDYAAEINFYRLCEDRSPFNMPKFYYGDICRNTGDSILITEFIPLPGDTELLNIPHFAGSNFHFDLKNMSYATCQRMVRHTAELAGMYKAGKLGPTELLHKTFNDPRKNWDDLADNFRQKHRHISVPVFVGAMADSKFLETAALAQNLVFRLAAASFPNGTVGHSLMKEYRSLVTMMYGINFWVMWWYLQFQVDYVALGRDRTNVDSAFSCQRHHWSGGLRDWEGVSVAPLGSKIWDCLRCADAEVFNAGVDDLLTIFIDVYHKSGGPQLDFVTLRVHVVLAAAIESITLLNSVHGIHQALPVQQWSSIRSLNDSILDIETQRGPLWQCVKSFANTALLLKNFRVSELFNVFLGSILFWYAQLSEPIDFYTVKESCGSCDIRVEAESSSALVACLRPGLCIWSRGRTDTHIMCASPVLGWACADNLQRAERAGDFFQWNILGMMLNVRRQYVGLGQKNEGISGVAAVKLYDEIVQYDWATGLIEGLKRGKPKVVHGSFLAQRERCDWWPADYEHWAAHSFLAFEDGSIADIAADAFDDVPQIWFPADAQRYTFDSKKADDAQWIRNTIVGIHRWKKMSSSVNAEKRGRDWWVTEGGGALGRLQKATALENEENLAPDKASKKEVDFDAAIALRHGAPLPLPPISRRMNVGGGSRVTIRRLTDANELEVLLVEKLFSDTDVDMLLKCCETRKGFKPSLISTKDAKGVSGSHRTSWSCAMLWHGATRKDYLEAWRSQFDVSEEQQQEEMRVVQDVTRRCANLLEVEPSHIEPLQLVKYTPGQFFKPHLDTHSEPERATSFNGEQRTQTLLVFLNDVPASDGGGCLHFPLLGLRVPPKKGSAVLWKNLRSDGTPDPHSLHEGEAPKVSEKYAMNVWVVDRPLTKMEDLINAGRRAKEQEASKSMNSDMNPERLDEPLEASNTNTRKEIGSEKEGAQQKKEKAERRISRFFEAEDISKYVDQLRKERKLSKDDVFGIGAWEQVECWARGDPTVYSGKLEELLGRN